MKDTWLFIHLPGGEARPGLPAWSAELTATRARYTDSGDGMWFLDRRDGEFGLWVRTGHGFGAPPGQAAPEPPTGRLADRTGRRRAEELAKASSELALDLSRAGEPTDWSALPVAMLHLWSLLGAVHEDARSAFLFSCWESWTRGMPPERRITLAKLAATTGDAVLARTESLLGDEVLREMWQRHVDVVARIAGTARPADTTPLNYLLFDHVGYGVAILGLPRETTALAAAVLRGARNGAGSALPRPGRLTVQA
jgi:hypothetical protein